MVSLCMIVRDEAELVAGCLSSVAGVVDEIVVVDTGSSDTTASLAASMGARVVSFPWCDDFSAARNAALDAASGSWVLVLDADERLGPGAAEAIRSFVGRDDVDCGLLALHDAARLDASVGEVLDGSARLRPPVLLPRLFRRTAGLRWEGRVHETVDAWLAPRVERAAALEVAIVHYGAVPSLRAARGKGERNRALLRRACAERPDDPTPWTYLASELVAAGEMDGATDAARAAWSALVSGMENGSVPSGAWVGTTTVVLQVLLLGGGLREAVDVCRSVDRWMAGSATAARVGAHPNLCFLRAHLHESLAATSVHERGRQHHLRAASAGYRGALAGAGVVSTVRVEEGVAGWRSWLGAGAVALQLGRVHEARAAFDAVLAVRHDDRGALLGLAECALADDALDEAEARLAGLEEGALACALALRRGDLAGAHQWAQHGDGVLPHHRSWVEAARAEGGMDVVFVGGAGRSGTTLLRAMLHAHPRLHAGPEAKIVPDIAGLVDQFTAAHRDQLRHAGIDAALLDRSVSACLHTLLEGMCPAGLRLVEKTPHNVLHLRVLGRLFPRARFVHVVRDPRAVVASLLRQDWRDGRGQRLPWCEDAVSAATYWRDVVGDARAQAVFVLGRYLEVAYEDLVTAPEATMRRVLEFLGEDWDAGVLAHEVSDVVLPEGESSSEAVGQAVHGDRVDSWRVELTEAQLVAIEEVVKQYGTR